MKRRRAESCVDMFGSHTEITCQQGLVFGHVDGEHFDNRNEQ
jgi:hypothetical protein